MSIRVSENRAVGEVHGRAVRVTKKTFRPDIQGLRMIAVIVVILDHLFAWPTGGYVGVDVFFVISGFLITGHLFREHQKNGKISFKAFYRRRIKRILPIATLVLLFTVGASYVIYLGSRATGIFWDAIWALFFSANWHFALDGTDYWASDGLESPLQHYWSLAVEEQFYFLWPLLIVLVLGGGAALKWKNKTSGRTLLVAMIVVSSISFAWALWESSSSPTWAYFSTFSRAWELGVGAILAVVSKSFARIPDGLRPFLAWLGLFGIMGAVVFLDESATFPAPWALLPVLSTALVIAVGTGGDQRFLFPITNRAAGYIGDISYSLYLWHWPVIVLTAALLSTGPSYYLTALTITVALSTLSYHFLENPIRKSTWLDRSPEAQKARNRSRRRRHTTKRPPAVAITGIGVVAVASCALVVLALVPPKVPIPVADSPSIVSLLPPPEESTDAGPVAGPEGELASEISASIRAVDFPIFAPSVDSLGTQAWVAQAAGAGCADIDVSNVQSCASGPTGDLDVAVLGDSFAIAWMPGVRAAYEALGYRVHAFTRGQCPAFSASVLQNGGEAYPECDETREWAIDYLNDLQPDIVILASSTYTQARLASGRTGQSAAEEIRSASEATVAALAPSGSRVFVLGAPPLGVPLQDCVTRLSRPSNCTSTTSEEWKISRKAEREAAEASGAQYVDTQLWFCNADGICPGFVGATPVRADAGHMTFEYSERLAPLIAKIGPSASAQEG